jgi:hypothetical protein
VSRAHRDADAFVSHEEGRQSRYVDMTETAPSKPQPPFQDCLPCRLVGAGAFTGIGTYALFEAGRQGAFAKHPPRIKTVGGGRITAVIGIGEFNFLLLSVLMNLQCS